MEDTIKLKGALELVLKNLNGEVVETVRQNNVVVTTGRVWVLKQIASSLMTTNQSISYLAVGTSTTSPTTADTALGNEYARKQISSFITDGLTSTVPYWRAQVLFASNEANTTLSEAGLFNSSSGGTMLARATFGTINKTTSNTLEVNYYISG
jgi:hypothetical protein